MSKNLKKSFGAPLQGTPPPVNPPSLRHNICVTGDSYRVIAQPPVAKLKPCRLGGVNGGHSPLCSFYARIG